MSLDSHVKGGDGLMAVQEKPLNQQPNNRAGNLHARSAGKLQGETFSASLGPWSVPLNVPCPVNQVASSSRKSESFYHPSFLVWDTTLFVGELKPKA